VGKNQSSGTLLAHGWRLQEQSGVSATIIRDFIRPAVRAVPSALALLFTTCRISLRPRFPKAETSSQWFAASDELTLEVASEGIDGHELAIEILLCLGHALWEAAPAPARQAYLKLLGEEVEAGVAGEIDDESLEKKRALFASRASARSRTRLQRYARTSFACTVAEYIHALWHDVTVRTGPEHLPPRWLRRRLELLALWFPPDRGYRLFPRGR
jgi:hypothetical protein